MTGNKQAVALLVPLFRAADEPSPLLLLGAGASFRSGVPTAGEAVKQIARLVYSERELGGARPPERVRPTEWEPWLHSLPWFLHGADRLAENFPLAVEHLLTPAEFRKRVLLDLMKPQAGISPGYCAVADFVMRGFVRTILTTNFDTCLLDALKERQPHIRQISEVNRSPGDYDQFNVFAKCQVVWLHGRAEEYSDRNETAEVEQLDARLVASLRPILEGAPLVVVGYRGSELSIMEGLLSESREGRLDFPQGIYWCLRHGETPHPHVEALSRRLRGNFKLLRIDGFDELFADLEKELAGQDRFAGENSKGTAHASEQAFDEAVVDSASLDDLDMDLALSVLRQYCEKLKRAPVTRETLLPLMREQGLLVSDQGTDRITAGAILLFGKRTQDFFRHAVVVVTEAGKKRDLYEGNLIAQHQRLLTKLESDDVNPLLKVKQRRQHGERSAYPPRALVELVVNMLVHRDYAVPEPAAIEVHPAGKVLFSNPGGLTPKLARYVVLDSNGRFTPAGKVTDARNPALCDIFFGMSAMEGEGTGLADVGDLMLESGGTSAFYHHAPEGRFEARISRPQPSAGSSTVARSDVPTGIYVLNMLPFTVLPDSISLLQLKRPWNERPRDMDLSECGTFVTRGTELWSFVPLPILTTLLKPIIDVEASVSVARDDLEKSPDAKRVLSWLLRKHWERYLYSFRENGLILEEGRKRRAYFEGREGSGRTIVWDSPQRRGNRRDVVKKRGEGTRAWCENEGFGFEIVEYSGLWCVRIKPFYMFTTRNGRTPLPSFARAAKATSRMKFDRNKNVEADLTFWSSFLGKGAQTINLGDHYIDDLLVEALFLTVEVPELGLLKDEDRNRMPA